MPAIMDKIVKVVGISPAVELSTGDLIYSVSFGTNIPVTEAVLKRAPQVSAGVVGKTVGASDLVLFVKADEIPYKVGSEWRLRIGQNGSVSLVQAR